MTGEFYTIDDRVQEQAEHQLGETLPPKLEPAPEPPVQRETKPMEIALELDGDQEGQEPFTERPPSTFPEMIRADKIAREAIAKYREYVPALKKNLEQLSATMGTMRNEFNALNERLRAELKERGISDEKARLEARGIHDVDSSLQYDALRERLTDSHAECSALRMRVGEIADRVPGTPGGLVSDTMKQEAMGAMQDMDDTMARIEKLFRESISDHNAWTRENPSKFYGNRRADFDEFQKRELEMEFYNQRVIELMAQVQSLEEAVDAMKAPTLQDMMKVLSQINDISVNKLGALDAKVNPVIKVESKEKKQLLDMIDKLRARVIASSEPVVEQQVPEVVPTLELEMNKKEYEFQVGRMMKQVIEWEGVADILEKNGKLTSDVRADMLEELRKYPAELLELDEKAGEYFEQNKEAEDPRESDERRTLIGILKKLRERLSDEFYIDADKNEPEPRATAAASIHDVRAVHRKLRATYASVQHTLSVEQRRAMRTRIASFTKNVYQAELAHAMTHAAEHAPLVAHASLAGYRPSAPRRFEVRMIPDMTAPQLSTPKRGLFGALGDAFRLK